MKCFHKQSTTIVSTLIFSIGLMLSGNSLAAKNKFLPPIPKGGFDATAVLKLCSGEVTPQWEPCLHTVFVTDFMTSGRIEYAGKAAIEAADAVCNDEASAAGLQQSGATNFAAWLSDGSSNAVDDLTEGKFQLVDGTPIADSLRALTSGTIQHPINMNALGVSVGTISVWTGTNREGISYPPSYTCGGWMDPEPHGEGAGGNTASSTPAWTDDGTGLSCGYSYPIYCFHR